MLLSINCSYIFCQRQCLYLSYDADTDGDVNDDSNQEQSYGGVLQKSCS